MKFSSIFSISAVALLSLSARAASHEPTPSQSSKPTSENKTADATCPPNMKAVIEDGQIICVGVNANGVTIKCPPLAAGGDPLKGLNVTKPGSGGSGGTLC